MTKNNIKKALQNGQIIYKNNTVIFEDGHKIGGVIAKTQNELINIINKCLCRQDFSIPNYLK